VACGRYPSHDADDTGSGGSIPVLAAKEEDGSSSRSREGSDDRFPAQAAVRLHLQADGGVDVRVQGVFRLREGAGSYLPQSEESEQAVVHHLEEVSQVRSQAHSTTEAGGVRRDDDISALDMGDHVPEEPLQEACPAQAGHGPAQHRMIGYANDAIVLGEHVQQTFRLAEGEVKKLLDQERDQYRAFVGGRPSDLPPTLPERELICAIVYGLERQPNAMYLDLGASTEVDAEGVEVRLSVKYEYLPWHFHDRGFQSSHLFIATGEWILPHFNIL